RDGLEETFRARFLPRFPSRDRLRDSARHRRLPADGSARRRRAAIAPRAPPFHSRHGILDRISPGPPRLRSPATIRRGNEVAFSQIILPRCRRDYRFFVRAAESRIVPRFGVFDARGVLYSGGRWALDLW